MHADKNTHMENLRIEYREVSQNHRAISDFRAKLLTLLPLASGAGIFLLLRKQSEPLDSTHIAAIGVFGFVITLGLFFHELRGILKCGGLVELGKSLEEQLELDEGQFTLDYKYYNPTGNRRIVRKLFHEIIGPRGAAWIIYPSVCIAWLYVASVGLGFTMGRFLILLALLSIVAGFSVARWIWKFRNKHSGKAVRR